MENLINNSRLIREKQSFKEIYSKYFSGVFSPYIAAAAFKYSIHPNVLTLAMIPAGTVGAIFFLIGGNVNIFFGGLFFIILNILDAADGELARFSNKTSLLGDYYDRLAHYITDVMAYLSFGLGLFFWQDDKFILVVLLLLVLSHVSDIAIRDLRVLVGVDGNLSSKESVKDKKRQTKLNLPRTYALIGSLVFSNIAFFHVVTLLSILDIILRVDLLLPYFYVFTLVSIIKLVIRILIISKKDVWYDC
jgi:phosphatidylglycerophosphate synthase